MWYTLLGMRIYIPKYFSLYEIFPPEMEHLFGNSLSEFGNPISTLWLQMNPIVLVTLDKLRKKYGTAIMNTYHFNNTYRARWGNHIYRGWRPKDCSVGAKLSQHKMGCAADIVFARVDAEKVRSDLLDNPFDETFRFITSIEMNVGWFHFDCRPRDKAKEGILQIIP